MISKKDLEELALKIFHTNGQGITFSHLINEFGCSQKQAQRKLKNAIKGKDKQGILFTLDRKSPQQYYPTILKAEIIENLKKQNRPIKPTGSSLYQNPNIEKLKARYISELLTLLHNQPISIHKVQLKLFIDKNYYDELEIQQITKGNKSKAHEEKFGPRNVKYEVYPSGTIMMYIASSTHPFKLEVEEDVSSFFAFLGQVKDRLVHFLNDF